MQKLPNLVTLTGTETVKLLLLLQLLTQFASTYCTINKIVSVVRHGIIFSLEEQWNCKNGVSI